MDGSVSVIVNFYRKDNPLHFFEALDSVLNQTRKPSNVLIVSDGLLNQDLYKVVDTFVNEHEWFSYYETQENLGVWSAKNYALTLVDTPIVAYLDADDVMHPKRIELQTKFLTSQKLDICGTSVVEFTNDLKVINHRKFKQNLVRAGKFINSPINNSSLMMLTKTFFIIGEYRNVYCQEDYDFAIRAVSKNLLISNLDVPLTAFRINDTFYKRRGGLKFIKSEYDIYKARKGLKISKLTELSIFKLRLVFRLMPSTLRGLIYRSNVDLSGIHYRDLRSWREEDHGCTLI